jgi:alkylation response protein AidB-like acyl-CoA dehydrogenase
MDFTEPTEHRDLRDAIGAVTDKYGADYYAERAAAHEPTTELWQDLAHHGFIGINLPQEYGGGDAGMTVLAILCEETAAHGCPLLPLLVCSAISGELLSRYGTAQQRRDWLPRMASGDTKVVFAITEPDAGSNTRRISTSAVRSGDGTDYVLTGTKYYICGVDEADALIVAAVDHAMQVHGGNGISVEYGLLPQWGLARLLQIAPVSREMILNYVAQHSLRLPRSY